MAITSDLDGLVCEPLVDVLGEARCEVTLSVGRHLLSFAATDRASNTGSADAFLQVIAGIDVDDDGDGWTENQGDCDDTDSSVLPGAVEYCDGIDSDCNELIDDTTSCYDDDGDGLS
ncbi:MAG: putative metal-binding motif-containing protein, partial [Deltaproteobacteria bacterium]|nr:putative metal-binding motif-containing protein [Deltaproteobacteria bacterium]